MTEADRRLRDRLLKESGFDDLEDENGRLRSPIQQHGPVIGRGRSHAEMDALASYYQLAGQFLHEHRFGGATERRVWELHTEGASYTRIWRTVGREVTAGDLPGPRLYRRRVHAIVTKLRALMLGGRQKRRGRPRDHDGLRSHDLRLHVLLSPRAALALDHIRLMLKVSQAEAVRNALLKLAAVV